MTLCKEIEPVSCNARSGVLDMLRAWWSGADVSRASEVLLDDFSKALPKLDKEKQAAVISRVTLRAPITCTGLRTEFDVLSK